MVSITNNGKRVKEHIEIANKGQKVNQKYLQTITALQQPRQRVLQPRED